MRVNPLLDFMLQLNFRNTEEKTLSTIKIAHEIQSSTNNFIFNIII